MAKLLQIKKAPITPSKALSRRLVLRGLLGTSVVGLTLPVLEGMLDQNGEVYAQGIPIPTKFGVWFWGNGVRPEHWIPNGHGQGNQWQLSRELQPLADYKSHLSVLSGHTIKTGTHPHHAGMTGVMTGMPLQQVGVTRDTIVSTFAGPSADVYAAEHYAGTTPFRSLEVGVTHFRGTDEGTTFQHLSHLGPNSPNPSEYNAQTLFRRLFGGDSFSQSTPARQSVLDAVLGQVNQLKPKLGQNDRRRLDQHLSSIRILEQRLAADPISCQVPQEPGNYPDQNGQEQIQAKNEIMSDLLTLALACDLTSVFSVLFSTCGSGVIMHPVGAQDSLHRTSHDEAMSGSPATQPTVHASTIYTMEQLAYFLGRLKNTPVGAGNLLDYCSIMCTSEHTDGRIHSYDDFPFVIAGLGGGRLRGDIHHQGSGQESITQGVLTALRAGGVPMANFGTEEGYTETSISAFES